MTKRELFAETLKNLLSNKALVDSTKEQFVESLGEGLHKFGFHFVNSNFMFDISVNEDITKDVFHQVYSDILDISGINISMNSSDQKKIKVNIDFNNLKPDSFLKSFDNQFQNDVNNILASFVSVRRRVLQVKNLLMENFKKEGFNVTSGRLQQITEFTGIGDEYLSVEKYLKFVFPSYVTTKVAPIPDSSSYVVEVSVFPSPLIKTTTETEIERELMSIFTGYISELIIGKLTEQLNSNEFTVNPNSSITIKLNYSDIPTNLKNLKPTEIRTVLHIPYLIGLSGNSTTMSFRFDG